MLQPGAIENRPPHNPVSIPLDRVTAARRWEPAVCAVAASNASGRIIRMLLGIDMINLPAWDLVADRPDSAGLVTLS
jgi:hypothetical protein